MARAYIKWSDATNAQKIERASKLVEVLAGLSLHEQRKHFNMSDWLYKTDCGTVGCAAGFCGINPWFRARGFKIDLVLNEYDDWDAEFGMDPSEFFGNEIEAQIFTNSKFMNGGRKDYLLVLKAAKRYLQKLTAEVAVQELQQALEKASLTAKTRSDAFSDLVEE